MLLIPAECARGSFAPMGLIDHRYAFPGLTPRALCLRRVAAGSPRGEVRPFLFCCKSERGSYAPMGLIIIDTRSRGLRPGLHSWAALRLIRRRGEAHHFCSAPDPHAFSFAPMGLIDDRYAFPGLTPRALFLRRFAAESPSREVVKSVRYFCPLFGQKWGFSAQGCNTILPSIWLFSMCSWAAQASDNGNVRSTTGFRRPAKTCFNTSCNSPMVPM